MQHNFIHHPDGEIIINGVTYPLSFWSIVEPDYALPNGYIGELFTKGVAHHLIRVGNNTYDQLDINDIKMTIYVNKALEYENAYNAYLNGALVYNDNGTIVVSGPPLLTVNKEEITNDGVDSVVITCNLEDANITDEIRWTAIAPDGTEENDIENAVYGVDTWTLTTSHIGEHTVIVKTDNYGTSKINFKGV